MRTNLPASTLERLGSERSMVYLLAKSVTALDYRSANDMVNALKAHRRLGVDGGRLAAHSLAREAGVLMTSFAARMPQRDPDAHEWQRERFERALRVASDLLWRQREMEIPAEVLAHFRPAPKGAQS